LENVNEIKEKLALNNLKANKLRTHESERGQKNAEIFSCIQD